MKNVKCTEESCSEYDIVKHGFDAELPIAVICGQCNNLAAETEEEVTNADPAN